MAKGSIILLAIVLASSLAHTQVLGEISGGPQPDFQTAFSGSPLTCSSQAQTIRVPAPLVERARVKARLLSLLRDSLYDDAKGVVNIAREKEIKKLANKLKGNWPEPMANRSMAGK